MSASPVPTPEAIAAPVADRLASWTPTLAGLTLLTQLVPAAGQGVNRVLAEASREFSGVFNAAVLSDLVALSAAGDFDGARAVAARLTEALDPKANAPGLPEQEITIALRRVADTFNDDSRIAAISALATLAKRSGPGAVVAEYDRLKPANARFFVEPLRDAGTPDARARIVAGLRTPVDWRMRMAIIAAVNGTTDAALADAVAQCLKDKNPYAYSAAAQTLSGTTVPSARAALLARAKEVAEKPLEMSDDDGRVIRSLGGSDAEIEQFVLECSRKTGSDSQRLVFASIEALGRLDTPAARDRLVELMSSIGDLLSNEVARLATAALVSSHTVNDIKAARRAFSTFHHAIQRGTIERLQKSSLPQAHSFLLEVVLDDKNDDEIRTAAVHSLRQARELSPLKLHSANLLAMEAGNTRLEDLCRHYPLPTPVDREAELGKIDEHRTRYVGGGARERLAAAQGLVRVGHVRAAESARSYLTTEKEIDVRQTLLEACLHLNDVEATALFTTELKKPLGPARCKLVCVRGLAQRPGLEAELALVAGLKQSPSEIANACAIALLARPSLSDASLEVVRAGFTGSATGHEKFYVPVFAYFAPPSELPLMLKGLEHPRIAVRTAAAQWIERMLKTNSGQLLDSPAA